ncbi:N-acetylmuramoyl-L-alanine amidase [Alkalilimnicola ehrlichii MLHE-1]|uniref:N-acetylmuramoyl-L-alanine amidase AmiC n=1 Tax=Alkalilimnicola ehrlichii (strain ATCC BAA-1101 / DSM 17681 / MLHE-1) TaxID=187272 RepID=Q0AB63_ALKEH|nr:N-acetylmuramoyl-L-alanine amidase [Alkalilimnicola ehrlichii]ABI55924.1 N-acetylmuramoyl-L-alanine amidase [Alkalilimnicola ehrlichii MLHE-1]
MSLPNPLQWSIIIGLLLLCHSALLSAQTEVSGVRASDSGDTTRVVFDLGGAVEHKAFTLADPHRVVIDIRGARAASDLTLTGQGVVERLRSGARGDGDLRLVLDLTEQVRPRTFLVAPGNGRGHRLVVDLEPHGRRDAESAGRSADSQSRSGARAEPTRSVGNGTRQRDLVVAIDAGHGGVDPGAIGPGGTFEKDIALQVARRLARLLEDKPGLRPLMIRDGDYYMGLRDRTRKARENNADLFVSIHADALDDRRVRGSSVYVLSEQGATSEAARMLAQRENAADFIGGVSLKDKDDMVASVLVDLSRAATVESSLELGDKALEELGRTNRLLRGRVEQAGFAVLKSLDMPSMLVELGFISNPEEERLLRQAEHQQNLARALARSIERYAEDVMLPELRMAGDEAGGQEYVVRRGDTLSAIAQRHDVSVGRLRAANDLNGDNIVVGRTLVIP